jgi:ureidoacrylate peracid hydrolase
MAKLEVDLDPSRVALLVVDMQNDFCSPKGVYPGRPGASCDLTSLPTVISGVQALLQGARRQNILRVLIRGIYNEHFCGPPMADQLAQAGVLGQLCIEGTWGADYCDGISPEFGAAEVEVVKHRYSAFHDTRLPALLRANRIESVVVCGAVTSGCVESTARDAFFHDLFVVVAGDACLDYSAEKQSAHLAKLGEIFGRVMPASDVVACWDRLGGLDEATTPATSSQT